MIRRITTLALCALIAVSTLAGCSDKSGGDSAETDATTTAATQATPAVTTENAEKTAKKEAQIKQIYTPSTEDAAVLANEKTKTPIIYSGFDSKYFSTPAKVEDLPLAAAEPIYSHAGLHNYVEKNSALFDLGDSDGSFSTTAEKYMESFFADKAVVVISFNDKEGGGSYTLTGAWEEHLHAGDVHLDQLTFAVKKTPGENKNGHLIIEVDPDFLSLWDSISIELYE